MYFDSPFERCPRCREYVLLDQTVGECAREHGCADADCPLAEFFAGGAKAASGADEARTRPAGGGRSGA